MGYIGIRQLLVTMVKPGRYDCGGWTIGWAHAPQWIGIVPDVKNRYGLGMGANTL